MKCVIGLAFLSAALAAPQFNEAELSAFFDSLSSLLGQAIPSEPMTDILTFSTVVSSTPTEVSSVTATTDAFATDNGLPFDKRQAPGQLEHIVSSLNDLISPASTTEACGCATDVVDVPTTIDGSPTEVSSVAAIPTAPVVVPTAPAAGVPGEIGNA